MTSEPVLSEFHSPKMVFGQADNPTPAPADLQAVCAAFAAAAVNLADAFRPMVAHFVKLAQGLHDQLKTAHDQDPTDLHAYLDRSAIRCPFCDYTGPMKGDADE